MKRVLKAKNTPLQCAPLIESNTALDSAPNANYALNQARALYYDFFAGFFVFELLDTRKSLFEKQIEILAQSPIDSADLATFSALKSYITKTDLAMIKREYSQTFDIPFGAKPEVDYKKSMDDKDSKDLKGESSDDLDKGDNESNVPNEALEFEKLHNTLKSLPKGQIFLYLSHYNEGCLNGTSLLKAREIVRKTRFRLNKDGFKESEEHFGFLLLFMRYLLSDSNGDSIGDSSNLSESFGESISANAVFNELLRDMASKIADLLINRDDLPCYQKVGFLLKNFIKLEEEICAI